MLPDDVIRDPRHDELDRAGFAKALANAILTMRVDSSFVLSLEGSWGAGKSTLIEFVKYYLGHRAEIGPGVPLEADPIIIDLSPWWFSGSEDLLQQVMREISLQLRSDQKVLAKLKKLPNQLQQLSSALSSIEGSSSEPGTHLFLKALILLGRWFGGPKDVAALKQEIERTLRSQPHSIVIFFDDLDRLQPKELLQVFQVIKAIANFPRLIYVLAFDRAAVADNLKVAGMANADHYLEKIVQSVWSLPLAEPIGIAKLTETVINDLLRETPQEMFQQDRWQHLYFNGLKELVRTPRDVKRLANALRPAYPPVKLEVNPVDFIGFHALRVLVPLAYEFVVSNRDLLTNASLLFFRDEEHERKKKNAKVEQMLTRLDAGQREPVNKMLETMFPVCERRTVPSTATGTDQARWRQALQVCSPDRFGFYDRLTIPESAISASDLTRLLAAPSTEEFRSELAALARARAYDGSTKLKKFLEYAQTGLGRTLSDEERRVLLRHIFRVADDFITKLEPRTLPFQSYDWQFASLADTIIGLIKKGIDRVDAVKEAWIGGAALSLMVRCFYLWKERVEKYESGSASSITEFDRDEIGILRDVVLQKILELEESGRLQKTPFFGFVLHFWDEHTPDHGSRFASKISADDEGFADLVVAALRHMSPRSDANFVSKWTSEPLEVLVNRSRELLSRRPQWLREEHSIALTAFIDEVENPRDDFDRPITG